MKKYSCNPNEKFYFILVLIMLLVFLLFMLVVAVLDLTDGNFDFSELWAAVGTILVILGVIVFYSIWYIKKYSGYFYIDNNNLVIVKGKKSQTVNIESIRQIRLKPFVRGGLSRGAPRGSEDNKYQFLIMIKDVKEPVPFFITNSKLYKVLEPHNIRYYPQDFLERIKNELKNYKFIRW